MGVAESPTRVWFTDDARVAQKLASELKKEIAEESQRIAEGFAEDHADYKARTGYVKGLKRALELAGTIEQELRG